ncbi:putative OsmC-like protein [Saccharothrix ecbatanensis]|uniref:Putative OsmC-like protein n=1 Tax=Saccharothrix ecbatanensis TaxID=1105145 RepID=A0A7W9LYZ0_9PSEU|nr:OsmC family protein [Saccharothrix ecbatanensis]MBB5801163.1 putative OsmC-like protein [Saccharothrix ecbatanensis]
MTVIATAPVEVTYESGEEYVVRLGDHRLRTDQPRDSGGRDAGPSPVELLVASMAACTAFYAGRFLDRHGETRHGLSVTARYRTVSDPLARIAEVSLTVRVPQGLSERHRTALLAVVRHCTVHNTLRRAPEILIELTEVKS